jgi:hypothetical protein
MGEDTPASAEISGATSPAASVGSPDETAAALPADATVTLPADATVMLPTDAAVPPVPVSRPVEEPPQNGQVTKPADSSPGSSAE